MAQLLTPVKSATPFSGGSLSPSPMKAMDMRGFLGTILKGQDVFEQVEQTAKKASLRVHGDKQSFKDREEERLAFLEKDKLTSMRQIMAYEAEIANFATAHVGLNRDIQAAQDANALIQACINHAYTDKSYMTEVEQNARDEFEQAQQEELEAIEGNEEKAADGDQEEAIEDGEELDQEEQEEEVEQEGDEEEDLDLGDDDAAEQPTESAN